MSILKDLHIINIFNERDLELIKNYCLQNNSNLYQKLLKKKNSYTEQRYKQQEELNVINRQIFCTLKDGSITNLIYVELEKDKRTANVNPKINTYIKNLIPELCDYLILNDNMEEVFVFVKKSDQKTINNLIENDFISLSSVSDEEEYLPFLKEQTIKKESSRFI